MAQSTEALRKHQQISKNRRNMFVAIAIAAALVGFAAVATVFLVDRIIFTKRVIEAKHQTLDILRQNNANLPGLKSEIAVLETSEALRSVKLHDQQEAVKVVLDALPATNNPTALGASVSKLLDLDGIKVDSLTIENTGSNSEVTTSVDSLKSISFTFKVTGELVNLNQVLKNLERSIRAVNVDSLSFEIPSEDKNGSLTVTAHSFYQPMLEAKLDKITLEAGKNEKK